MIDFEISEEIREIGNALIKFIDQEVVPLEKEHANLLADPRKMYGPDQRYTDEFLALRKTVRMKSAEAGFYNVFGAEQLGGRRARREEAQEAAARDLIREGGEHEHVEKDADAQDGLSEAEVVAEAATETATRGAPVETEALAFEEARKAGTYQAYEDFIAAHPEGVFADLARMEMEHLAPVETAALPSPTGPILFSQPLASEDAAINGKSLQTLIAGTPLFPPIEGLDESYWKSQSCNYCHNWSQQALCDQGDFYASRDDASPARIQHPYGGPFKQSLADWAAAGCN